MRLRFAAFVLVTCLATTAAASEPTLYRSPTVNRTHVVFAYAGDLWSVPRSGGDATRLTTGVGDESDPVFSPDGAVVAFTGQYDGNTDVYVVAAGGGVPRRLTWHPGADEAVGWTRDGTRVLLASPRASHGRFPRLFTVTLDGGLPEPLPLPMAERGSYSPDGRFLAYEPLAQWQPAWKRYRGGQFDRIWVARLEDSTVETIPTAGSNDRFPMWVGDRVYFLSDRDGAMTLHAYDTRTRAVERILANPGLDIVWASAWDGDEPGAAVIVYEQFGSIHLYDVSSGRSTPVPVRVDADIATLRPRYEKVGERIGAAAPSPTGVRAVFEARGEILTVPADKGDPRNLTRTPGVMERDPAWSPDGRFVAYFSDASGEYALHLRDQEGLEPARAIPLPPLFYYGPTWSPDSSKIAFHDRALTLWYVEVGSGKLVEVDTNPIGLRDDVMVPAWSPDSRFIAYARQLDNRLRAVFVHSLETGRSQQVTDGLADARYPVFDRSGKYLFLTASTDLGPAFSFAEMSTFPHRATRSVYAVVLSRDEGSPLAPESDEEEVEDETATDDGEKSAKDEKKGDDESKEKGKDEPTPIRVDFDGIERRILSLPIPARDYVDLQAGAKGRLFLLERSDSAPGDDDGPPSHTVHSFDLSTREVKQATAGVRGFAVTANGEKALVRRGEQWFLRPVDELDGGDPLMTDALEVLVDPKVEWRQMYAEVWRGERDFFYDPALHGLDLEAAKATYAPYLDAVAHRSDLTYLFTEMLNQLTVGHMFIGGGDLPKPRAVPGGLLGCDFTLENGRYRFARVFDGERWNPDLDAPLAPPGVNVAAGEYLLAVDGRELTASDNVHARLENTAGRQVRLRVGPEPDGSSARDVTVVPVRDELTLRARSWVEDNRRRVAELSGGRLAYVYVPNTSTAGYESFNRYFFAQTEKQGAVIDERFNGGGSLADYIVEYLTRPLLNYIHFRHGVDLPTPLGAVYGPKAMLVNQLAGSGGDALPWYFRKMQVGPLIGTRTWGGLVAAFTAPELMDGGYVTAPDAAVYGLDGEWEVENVGVAPDIEVELDPAAWRAGRDPQLERAVSWLLQELERNPPPRPRRPERPRYGANGQLRGANAGR